MRALPRWSRLLVLVGLALTGSAGLDHAAPARAPAGRFAASNPDTQVVWTGQSAGYSGVGTGSWATYATTCTIPNFNASRRYTVRITNGSSSTTRVSEMSLLVNAHAVMVASDLTVNIASAVKVVKPTATTTLSIGVRGSSSSFVKLDMISTPDPGYLIWGAVTYTMPEVPDPVPPGGFYSETSEILSRPSTAAAPWMLKVDNGEDTATLEYRVSLPPNHEKAIGPLAEEDLRNLASQSGGQFYREEDLHTLGEKLEKKTVEFHQKEEFVLWNRWMLMLVIALFAIEWTIRKFNSLS